MVDNLSLAFYGSLVFWAHFVKPFKPRTLSATSSLPSQVVVDRFSDLLMLRC